MKQNTEEWDTWRANGLGASDICSILGISPYKTKLELWTEKQCPQTYAGEKREQSFIEEKGHRLEAKARVLYELTHLTNMPTALMEYSGWNIARCSMDGYNEKSNTGIEIKYVGKDVFNYMKENQEIPKEKEYFYPQIQHQYMVSGSHKIDLVIYCEDYNKIFVLPIPPNEKYIKEMLKEEQEFWESVKKKEKPQLSDKDGKKIKNTELKALIKSFVKVKLDLSALIVKEKAFKGDILSFLENNPDEDHELLIANNFKLTNKQGPESIEWIKIFDHLYAKHKDLISDDTVNQFKENINYENLVVHLVAKFEEDIDINDYKIEGKRSRRFYANEAKPKQKKTTKAAKGKENPKSGKKKT